MSRSKVRHRRLTDWASITSHHQNAPRAESGIQSQPPSWHGVSNLLFSSGAVLSAAAFLPCHTHIWRCRKRRDGDVCLFHDITPLTIKAGTTSQDTILGAVPRPSLLSIHSAFIIPRAAALREEALSPWGKFLEVAITAFIA